MLIPEHKFLVEEVKKVETSRNGKHKFQTIILNKPGYTDEFGEKKGSDDILECTAWNKTIDEVPPLLKRGDKVKATLNLQGRKGVEKDTGKEFYTKQLSIYKISML
ncbi:hypothetical protein OU798_07585 [Prolixibacteraceae bacterium Z1-6]|uniref:Uncharacterized protein n=1 Tax=Draconibacterium aestuarii TaxID=2998507 RepID=A0A9X3F433_9BACT|nr:hypothetical protein [Prolixibacteraceae bacterium Z1-6]